MCYLCFMLHANNLHVHGIVHSCAQAQDASVPPLVYWCIGSVGLFCLI
jgi:hypothetical protein